MSHPTRGLDDTVHQRSRLGILSIAIEADRVEFSFLRANLDLTAGNLSRHLDVLSDAGLVEVHKGYQGRRPRTWVSITRAGRTAYAAEIDALRALVSRSAQVAGRPAGNRAARSRSDTPPINAPALP